MLIVQICYFGDDGDARYRLHEPSAHLARLPGITTVDCHFLSRHLPELADLADILVMQSINDWDFLSLLKRRKAAGKITVFEANDYHFDIQPWNPIAHQWADRNTQELFLQFLKMADGVQTTSKALASRCLERGAQQVAIFPNHLTEVPPLDPMPDRPLTVGWAGSPGHFADWYYVVPALQQWLNHHPDVHLAVMTNELAKSFFQLRPERYHFTPFGSLADYLNFLRSLDIGLAPLLPTEYNRCRSDVKFLEYSSQGIAGIYADLDPYSGTVKHGENGLLYRTPTELIASLDMVSKSAEMRNKLREHAHAYVRDHRLLANNIDERAKWYRSLLGKRSISESLLSPNLANDAVKEQRYLKMLPRDAEVALLSSLSSPKPAEAAGTLARLVQSNPRYLAALQQQGKVLNDLRKPQIAIEVLERARLLDPKSARTVCEIGRSLFLLGEHRPSREMLDQALLLDPHYLPAWQYLLRLAALKRTADGQTLAQEAQSLFPHSYPIALLGVDCCAPLDSLEVLRKLLSKHVPAASPFERANVLAAFREAILKRVQTVMPTAESIRLLREACEYFPESAQLIAALASSLYLAGYTGEAYRYNSQALKLRYSAANERIEFGADQPTSYTWHFADHILSTGADVR